MDLLVDWYKRRPGKLRETLPPEFSAAVLRRIRENAQQISVESNEPALGNRVSAESNGASQGKQVTSDADRPCSQIHMAVSRTPGRNEPAHHDEANNMDEDVPVTHERWPKTWRKADFEPAGNQRKGGSARSLPVYQLSGDKVSVEFLETRLIALDFSRDKNGGDHNGRRWRRYENDPAPMHPWLLRQIASRAFLYRWLSLIEVSSIMTIIDEYEIANRAMRKRYRMLFRRQGVEPPKVQQHDFEPSMNYLNDSEFLRNLDCAMNEVRALHEGRVARMLPQGLDHLLNGLRESRRRK